METTVETPTPEVTPEAATEIAVSQVEKDARSAVFTYSAYVDLPEDCPAEGRQRGSCKDPEHFHAWLRLPNKFQHRDLREKAMACKARRQRQLRDPQADAYAVLEGQLDLMRSGDKGDLIEEIVGRDAWKDQFEALKDIAEIEADHQPEDATEPVMKYAHIEADQERLSELESMSEEDRPQDEFEELVRHVSGYLQAIEDRIKELQEPQRASLEERDIDDLVEIIKEDRIEADGTEEFLHHYNAWAVVFGTLHADKSGRKFSDLQHMKDSAAPEVIDLLVATFAGLERDAQEGKG